MGKSIEKEFNIAKQLEGHVVKLKQPLRALFDFAHNGYFVLNRDGLIIDVNPAALKMMGLRKEEVLSRSFLNYVLSEDQEIFRSCIKQLNETRNLQVCELRISSFSGHSIWLRLNMGIFDFKSETEIVLDINDITFQKQVDDFHSYLMRYSWIKSGKDFFDALAEYLSRALGMDYVCIDKLLGKGLEAQTVAIYFDGKFEDNVRYTLKDTPCGKVVEQTVCCFTSNVRNLFPKDVVLQEMEAESYAGITLWGPTGKPIGLIAVIGRKPLTNPGLIEKLLKQVSIRAASELIHRQMEEAIIDSHLELEKLVKKRTAELQKANDLLEKEIKKRKQKERSLLLAEEKYRTVADFTYDWETWVGPDGKFIYVSPSCYKITGYTVDEIMKDPSLVIRITHPDDQEVVRKHYFDSIKGKVSSCSIDFRIITRDGEERWIGHSCQPVYDINGKWIGQRGSNRDITERKKGESVLMASQRHLRALTHRIDSISEEERIRIAREIHDELGHLLTALKLDVEMLNDKPGLSEEQLKSELVSMSGMLDSLIDSVRKIATQLRPGILDHLGLCPAIEWQVGQFQKRTNINCGYSISVNDISFNKNETTIIYRIHQEILTNIARHSKADRVSATFYKKDGKVILSVSDNGVGFDPEENKQQYSLGLMGMSERALTIGGELKIESAVGKGTTISLILDKK